MIDIKITVPITILIEHLMINRDAHLRDFIIAKRIYFEDLREIITEMAVSADLNESRIDSYRLMLKEPVNETFRYDKYINMLKMSVNDDIEIGTSEYDKFVQDEWEWAVSARLLNSVYSSKAM